MKIPRSIIYFLITLLIIFLFIYFVPILSYQKKELPNGILISMHRFTGEICVKMPNNEFTCFQKDNPFYKEMLFLFNNH
jgi:hypothetical protein